MQYDFQSTSMKNTPNIPVSSPVRKEKFVCPQCGDPATRVKRNLRDRITSLLKPVKRYRCDFCNWTGAVLKDKS